MFVIIIAERLRSRFVLIVALVLLVADGLCMIEALILHFFAIEGFEFRVIVILDLIFVAEQKCPITINPALLQKKVKFIIINVASTNVLKHSYEALVFLPMYRGQVYVSGR